MANDVTTGSTTPTQAPADAIQGGIAQVRDAAAPMIAQAKQFAKDRPFATAALAGVLGVALLNTLRGR